MTQVFFLEAFQDKNGFPWNIPWTIIQQQSCFCLVLYTLFLNQVLEVKVAFEKAVKVFKNIFLYQYKRIKYVKINDESFEKIILKPIAVYFSIYGIFMYWCFLLWNTILSLPSEFGLSYLPLRTSIGLWTALLCILLVATDASSLVCYITRFTEEAFAALICIIFIYEALEKLFQLGEMFPFNMHDNLDNLTFYT